MKMENNEVKALPEGGLIRAMTLEDEDGFREFVKVLNDAHNLNHVVNRQWYRESLKSSRHILLVAEYMNQVVGIFTGMKNEQDPFSMNMNLAVLPKVRRRGFATALFLEGMRRAKEKGIQNVEAYGKLRLPGGITFLKNQGFHTLLYSWEMERDVQDPGEEEIEGIPPETGDLSVRIVNQHNYQLQDEEDYREFLFHCFDEKILPQGLEETLKDPSLSVCFIHRGEDLAGGLSLQMKASKRKGYLYDIGILPDYRGKGYGLYLLKEVLLYLDERGYEKAKLLVAGENDNALKLYEKAGFEVKDEEVIFYKHLF